MYPDPNQWPAVVSPCSDVVAWQPWWQVLHTCGRLQKSVSIWLRGNRTSYLFSKSHQIFASKQQILPHLCFERAIIRYNLTARILLSSTQGQNVFFFFHLQLFYPFSSHPSISSPFSVADLYLFYSSLSSLLPPFSSSVDIISQVLNKVISVFLVTGRGFNAFFPPTC